MQHTTMFEAVDIINRKQQVLEMLKKSSNFYKNCIILGSISTRDARADEGRGGRHLERASSEARSVHTSVFQYSYIQSFISSLNGK